MKKYTITVAKKNISDPDDFLDQVEIWHWDNHSQFDEDIKDPDTRRYIVDHDVIVAIGTSVNNVNGWVGKVIRSQP